MGCSNAKEAALAELQYIIAQITTENDILEQERDRLKSQHDDRPEEEKDSLQDLRVMHNDLEKEVEELIEIMKDFLPIPDIKDECFTTIREKIEKIARIQTELEDQSEQLKDMTFRRKDLQKEHASLESLITQTELEIKELEGTVEKQEMTLKEHGTWNEGFVETLEKRKTLVNDELREENTLLSENHENSRYSKASRVSEDDEESLESENQSYEALLTLSELEINKELKEVEEELEDLSTQVQELEMGESEMQQMENYIYSLQNKLKATEKNLNIRGQLDEAEDKISSLKEQKRLLKEEVSSIKKYSNVSKHDDTCGKIQALNEILQKKSRAHEHIASKAVNEALVVDIEETLKKARDISISIKRPKKS